MEKVSVHNIVWFRYPIIVFTILGCLPSSLASTENLGSERQKAIKNAEILVRSLGAEEFSIRIDALKRLREISGFQTDSQLKFWLKWVESQKKKHSKNPQIIAGLTDIIRLENFSIKKGFAWSGQYYRNSSNKIFLHGEVNGTTRLQSRELIFEYGVLHGAVKKTFQTVSETITFANGVRHGPITIVIDKIERLKGQYNAGLKDGTWIYFDENEKEVGRYDLNDGTGQEKAWDSHGRLKYISSRKFGFRHGETKYWNNGKLCFSGEFEYISKLNSSIPIGTVKSWNADGELECNISFNRGVPENGFAKIQKSTLSDPIEVLVEFKKGKILRKGLEDPDWKISGVFTFADADGNNKVDVQIQSHQIWSGSFLGLTFDIGKLARSNREYDQFKNTTLFLQKMVQAKYDSQRGQ